MEAALRRFSHGGHAITMEENNVEASGDVDHRRGCQDEIVSKAEEHEPGHVNKPKFPELKDFLSNKKDNKLECARAEMNEVREENHRLRANLDRMTNDYQTLKMKFQDIIQDEAKCHRDKESTIQHKDVEEAEFFSLSLGRSTSDSRKVNQGVEDKQLKNKDLALSLDCKIEASRKFHGEVKEEAGETSPGSKVSNKTTRSVDDEVSQPVKKARVSVRARCDAPTMSDGCQWRKYGQKISKGNPCPRAYYRCTVAPSCPVRKQVQRCSGDMSILITTYEGTHNHPLPISATAMASTTSAAASMLLSGSTSSQSGLGPSTNITTTSSNLHGLNFYMSNSDNLMSKQFHLPSSSMLSSSAFQTVTLDLTSTPSSSSSNLNRNFLDLSHSYSRYLPTNLNFNSFGHNTIPWGSYGGQACNGNQIGNIYNSHMHNTKANTSHPSSQILPDTITKAISTNPNFQSVLAAALTSIIGINNSGGNLENLDQKLKLAEAFSIASNNSNVQAHKGNNCASSYLSKTLSSTNLHAGNTTLLQPSFSSSISKNASASPDDNGNHTD